MKLQVDRRVIQLNRPSPTSPDAFPRLIDFFILWFAGYGRGSYSETARRLNLINKGLTLLCSRLLGWDGLILTALAFLSDCIALSLIDSALPALGIDLDAPFPRMNKK